MFKDKTSIWFILLMLAASALGGLIVSFLTRNTESDSIMGDMIAFYINISIGIFLGTVVSGFYQSLKTKHIKSFIAGVSGALLGILMGLLISLTSHEIYPFNLLFPLLLSVIVFNLFYIIPSVN
jgi:uncharacterized protein YacL